MPPFQTKPLNITGPSYKDRSKPLTGQESRNLYHELIQSGKDRFVTKSFPGQLLFGTTGVGGIDRGQHQMREVDFRVAGDRLYEVSTIGVHTDRGEIPGTDRCIFADDGENLFVVSEGIVNQYNNITELKTTVNDVNIVGAQSVAFINNQFAYTFPQLTVFSNVGDGATASGLNAINEESNPDNLVRDYVFDQVLYRFGTRSCPNWYNSGVGVPPFDKIEGQIINTGLTAIHSLASTHGFIYWLGTDLQVYRARGGQLTSMSTAAIAGAIQGYATTSDAFGQVITVDNKIMYVLTFPSADKTWCLNEELGRDGWFELSEGITSGQYNGGSMINVYGKTLVGDRINGNLYELDFNTYDQNGETWRRRRVIASVNGDLLGQKGKRVRMSRMEFLLETGVGLLTGQGSDPRIMIEPSYDGGRTWATGVWMRIGRLGEYDVRAEWFSMHSFYDMMVRLTTSDPVALNIYSATIDLKLAGR